MAEFSQIEKEEALDVLNYHIRACERCRLAATRKHSLTGEGNRNARIMFVALSPGAKEDIENKMFVGPSGKVFDRLLKEAEIAREKVYMTNLVKCILPKNRKPKADEIKTCGWFLDQEIEIIKPEVIAPLGFYATQAILNRFGVDTTAANMSFKNINGQLLTFNKTKVLPLTHPSALLYNPSFETGTIEKYKKLQPFL